MLLFMPNEQIYAFIYQQDSLIPDAGLWKEVLFVSSLVHFAVLPIIRKAAAGKATRQDRRIEGPAGLSPAPGGDEESVR